MSRFIIDTNPCETCDFAPTLCGRDIEDCMRCPENKRGVEPIVIRKHTGERLDDIMKREDTNHEET